MYEITLVKSRKEWRQFLDVQRRIQKAHSHAMPLPEFEVQRLLDTDANPALRGRQLFLLVVRRGDTPVGRCSLLLPRNREKRTAILGFFACIDDARAAQLLFNEAEFLATTAGTTCIHGPFSPTTSGVTGVQLDRFDDPNVLSEACSPPWYAAQFKAAGFEIERYGRTWLNPSLQGTLESLAARLPDRTGRFRIRTVGMRNLAAGISDLAAIFESAFSANWGRDSMSVDDYLFTARFLLPAWQPGSFALVYDDTRPAGALISFPDINPAFRGIRSRVRPLALWNARRRARRSRSLVTFAMGLHPDYQNTAAGLMLARHMTEYGRRFDRMYSSWITEGNAASERIATRFGLRPWRRFAVYRKDIPQ